jgi:hypothetical protein
MAASSAARASAHATTSTDQDGEMVAGALELGDESGSSDSGTDAANTRIAMEKMAAGDVEGIEWSDDPDSSGDELEIASVQKAGDAGGSVSKAAASSDVTATSSAQQEQSRSATTSEQAASASTGFSPTSSGHTRRESAGSAAAAGDSKKQGPGRFSGLFASDSDSE